MGVLEMWQQTDEYIQAAIDGADDDAVMADMAEQAFIGRIVSTGNLSGWRVA